MITPVRRGEIVRVWDEISQSYQPNMVLSPCQHRAQGFHCTEHDCFLANIGQLSLHLEIDEPHRVAVWCAQDRCYHEANQEQLTALDPHQQQETA